MLSVTELELYRRVCELEGISFIECNKDILDLLKLTYNQIVDLREINRNNVKIVDTNFLLAIDNFKQIDHKLKTLESKCDKTLHQFNKKLELLDGLEEDIEDRLHRQNNIIILNFNICVFCLIISLLTFFV
jgi:hypothetical protein